jgi:predicted hydrocarbon binding protein
MNGIVFVEIEKFAHSRLSEQAWREVVRLAGVPSRIYYRVADYPDEEAFALLSTLSDAMKEPLGVTLENLGEFIVPDLIKMSRYWIKPDWKTVDLIANTEKTIHEMLRSEGSQTNPPRLQCRRSSPEEVVVTYNSSRKLCALAKGIIMGVGKHYGERVTIAEPTCMLKGAPACQLVVNVASPAL